MNGERVSDGGKCRAGVNDRSNCFLLLFAFPRSVWFDELIVDLNFPPTFNMYLDKLLFS